MSFPFHNLQKKGMPSKGPGKAGLCEPNEIQQGHMQGIAFRMV